MIEKQEEKEMGYKPWEMPKPNVNRADLSPEEQRLYDIQEDFIISLKLTGPFYWSGNFYHFAPPEPTRAALARQQLRARVQ